MSMHRLPIQMTPFKLMKRYLGILERAGDKDHPLIQYWLSLCGYGYDAHDEVPWCSAALNGIAHAMDLPRSKSAAARSWLMIGAMVRIQEAEVGFDVVILKRGIGPQPGPEVLAAPGHVGLFAGMESEDRVRVLGGNQGDTISIASFPVSQILGIRRL